MNRSAVKVICASPSSPSTSTAFVSDEMCGLAFKTVVTLVARELVLQHFDLVVEGYVQPFPQVFGGDVVS